MLNSYNTNIRFIEIILFGVLLFNTSNSMGQLVTDDSPTPMEILEGLYDEGLFVYNVEYNGEDFQMGSFTCNDCGIGIEEGLLMTNGLLDNAEGPNHTGDESFSAFNPEATEEDLEILFPDTTLDLSDVAVMEFDFRVAGDSVSIDYVFASEEYPEFLDTNGPLITDPFGIFVSGPGINGQFSNGAKNIAVVPGTETPVVTANLNNGPNNEGPCLNCEHYIANPIDPSNIYSVQYDGYSIVLSAGIGNLQVGETYHMKIAIADANNQDYDSGVFFANKSLRSNRRFVDFRQGDSSLEFLVDFVNECESLTLEIVRLNDLSEDQDLVMIYSGMAVMGYDLNELPEEAVIPANEESISIPVHTYDSYIDDMDTLTFSALPYYEPDVQEDFIFNAYDTFIMTNHPEIPELPENPVFEDTVELCSGNSYTLHPDSYNYFWFDVNWSIQDGPELSSNDSVLVSPNQTTTYIFTADHQCSDLSVADTITLQLPVNLNVELSPDSSSLIAQEDFAHFQWLDCN
ncbi:choice-of-anchor L domain-containing protein, partial [Halocola ammonii]